MSALREWLAMDGFAWPWMLLAIPLPLLVHLLLPARGGDAQRIANAGSVAAKPRGLPWLALIAWCLLCIAAARPQQLGPAIAPPQVGRDLMLAVDLSASMGEEDMELGGRIVDRLTAAKAVLADFLDRRVGDRVGLVVFGERAYALTPLTADRDSVREQLQGSVVGLVGRATAIGDAIALSTKRLQKQPTDQRVLILLTDGVNTAGTLEPDKAAQIARDNRVRIHAIAFGGDGGGLSCSGLSWRGCCCCGLSPRACCFCWRFSCACFCWPSPPLPRCSPCGLRRCSSRRPRLSRSLRRPPRSSRRPSPSFRAGCGAGAGAAGAPANRPRSQPITPPVAGTGCGAGTWATGCGAGTSTGIGFGSRSGAGCAGLTLVTAGAGGMLSWALVSEMVASLRGVPRW